MGLANYTDLAASVANFLHRSDLTSIIPDLITLGEVRINGDLDARLQDTAIDLFTVAGVQTVSLPSDLINMRHISVDSTTPIQTLQYMTPDAAEKAYPWKDTGTPQVFTVIGTYINLYPIPDSIYTLDCVYKARVPSLEASGTNYLMTTYPNVYLYATLCESAPYLGADDRVAMWEAKYRESVQVVNAQDWYSGSTMRVRVDTL